MKIALLTLLVNLSAMPLSAETAVDMADRLYDEERHREGYEYLLTALDDPSNETQLADLYWRLSRAIKEVGDIAERKGTESSELVAIFEEGITYADRAIDLNPESYWGYYWKSVNISRLAATRGFFKSIRLVKPMRDYVEFALQINPSHSNSYYLLSIMYKSAPGWPIAFGNVDFAVSLCRKAIDLNRADYESGRSNLDYWYYLELARHLQKRDWSETKRIKRQPVKANKFAAAEDEMEGSFYYEGTVEIEDQSDITEAVGILKWLIAQYSGKLNPKTAETLAYNEAVSLP